MSDTVAQTDAEFVRKSSRLALAWTTAFFVASLGLITYGDVLMQTFV